MLSLKTTPSTAEIQILPKKQYFKGNKLIKICKDTIFISQNHNQMNKEKKILYKNANKQSFHYKIKIR